MHLLKILGLIISFLVPTAFGFFKSYGISKRYTKLRKAVVCISELAESVKVESSEKNKLFSKCFDKELLNQDFTINSEWFKEGDLNIFNEFFGGFGLKDKNSEYERTKLYLERIKMLCEDAGEEKNKLCKLYSSLGLLSGLCLCIFLI